MPNINLFTLLLITASVLSPAKQALSADVGVSVSIGQPGFYGHIDIGDYPYPVPRVIYREPVVIVHRNVEELTPIYLRVPPAHARRWSRYCNRYGACDRPVYFVEDRWYTREYAPQYRERHAGRKHDSRDGKRRQSHDEHSGHDHGRNHD